MFTVSVEKGVDVPGPRGMRQWQGPRQTRGSTAGLVSAKGEPAGAGGDFLADMS